MPRQHPTVLVPNIGPMDHAWDLLGEWQTEFELPETESPVHGVEYWGTVVLDVGEQGAGLYVVRTGAVDVESLRLSTELWLALARDFLGGPGAG